MIYRHLTYYLACIVMALTGLSSCQGFDNDSVPKPYNGKMIVSLTFSLDNAMSSRADGSGMWNPNYPSDPGDDFDNGINTSTDSFHVMLIDIDGNVVHLEPLQELMYQGKLGEYKCLSILDLQDKNWTAGDYRVMIVVNVNKTIITNLKKYNRLGIDENDKKEKFFNGSEKATTIDNVFCLDWYNEAGNFGNHDYIPMWGVTTTHLNLNGSNEDISNPIYLLRSVAKVRVRLEENNSKLKGSSIEKIVVHNVFRCNAVFPGKISNASYTNYYETGADAMAGMFNARDKCLLQNLEVLPDKNNMSQNDQSFIFYLPEYNSGTRDQGVYVYNGAHNVTLDVTLKTPAGDKITYENVITIDNTASGLTYPNNRRYCVIRNHYYDFTVTDYDTGSLKYEQNCWSYSPSAIGWEPKFIFSDENDSEVELGIISNPSYPKNNTSLSGETNYADYQFTLTEPDGAVWKAFLVEIDEEGVEHYYSGEDGFNDDFFEGNKANTPSGFFFGTGNDNENNQVASTTGRARKEPYNIKVGTRFRTVGDSKANKNSWKVELENEDGNIVKLNDGAKVWKDKGKIPICYLVIKIAYDGVNFTEELKINPVVESPKDNHIKHKYYGSETRIQIRQVFPFYNNTEDEIGDFSSLVSGKYASTKNGKLIQDYIDHCWWGFPEDYKLPTDLKDVDGSTVVFDENGNGTINGKPL